MFTHVLFNSYKSRKVKNRKIDNLTQRLVL